MVSVRAHVGILRRRTATCLFQQLERQLAGQRLAPQKQLCYHAPCCPHITCFSTQAACKHLHDTAANLDCSKHADVPSKQALLAVAWMFPHPTFWLDMAIERHCRSVLSGNASLRVSLLLHVCTSGAVYGSASGAAGSSPAIWPLASEALKAH